ncbi:IS110 family transposase [Acrocarpospora sp. B8E8]|uniref:IS110 family transposase n=1 Tax=Acrocarpospora sp. B8E8 TaxID=3153572 RepID=UPI00325C5858
MREVEDEPLFIDRVAGLDIGKKEIEVTIRVPGDSGSGRRMSETRTFGATRAELLKLADWLRCWSVGTVGMEATGDYWKPPFFVLEAEGFDCLLYNAGQVKALPGRPKTDRADSIWLAKITERGMIVSSFVPPEPIRRLRTHTRYRRSLVQARTAEMQRVEKLLEDAHLKLSSVASKLFTESGRAMMDAIVAGQRDPKVLAQLARGRMRSKITALEEALDCSFLSEEHVAVLTMMLATIDHHQRQIATLTAAIEQLIEPYARQVEQLDEVPGIGTIGAADIIAEIGVDMRVFTTASHLVSWAKFAPQVKQSAGKRKGGNATGRGNPYLGAALGEAAIGAGRTQSFLGARYRRLNRRMPKKKALVATGNSQLVIIHALLSDPEARYTDLGADYYETRMHVRRQARNHVKGLERLGYKVTIEAMAPDENHLPVTPTR